MSILIEAIIAAVTLLMRWLLTREKKGKLLTKRQQRMGDHLIAASLIPLRRQLVKQGCKLEGEFNPEALAATPEGPDDD